MLPHRGVLEQIIRDDFSRIAVVEVAAAQRSPFPSFGMENAVGDTGDIHRALAGIWSHTNIQQPRSSKKGRYQWCLRAIRGSQR